VPKGTTRNWQHRLVVVPSYISYMKAERGGVAHENIMERGDGPMWAEHKICINSSIEEGYQKAETTTGLARENSLPICRV